MDEEAIKRHISGMLESDKNGLILAVVRALYADRDGNLDPDNEWSSATPEAVYHALRAANIPIAG